MITPTPIDEIINKAKTYYPGKPVQQARFVLFRSQLEATGQFVLLPTSKVKLFNNPSTNN